MGQHNTFGLEIYASNRQFYVGRGQSITFPVEDGEMQVLPHHEDMIAAIVPGEILRHAFCLPEKKGFLPGMLSCDKLVKEKSGGCLLL